MSNPQFNPQQYQQYMQMQQMQQMQQQRQQQMMQEFQMREILSLFNNITLNCFKKCVTTVDNKDLKTDEDKCISSCAEKMLKFHQLVGTSFQENMKLVQQ